MTPLDRGWQIVPIPPGEKAPRAKGWQEAHPSADEVRRHLARDGNIGVRLGPASGELVDIDIDCPEALALADIYLPTTGAEFGRASKPRSHRLYVALGARFETFKDPRTKGKNTLIELRADGYDGGAHQTLCPPSIADGERREWHGDIIAPAVISAAVLRLSVAWLAVGALVRRHVSVYASERPDPDLVDVLMEADPLLGELARQWTKRPSERDARTAPLRPHREMAADEIDLAEMVAAIPNNEDWTGWNALGLAIYAATGGSDHGAIVWDDWSAKSARYNPYITADRWRHFHRSPPSRTGVGKIIALALAAGWRPRKARVAR